MAVLKGHQLVHIANMLGGRRVATGCRGDSMARCRNCCTLAFSNDGGTRLSIHNHFPSQALRDAFVKIGMSEGWGGSLDKLSKLLSRMRR